MSSYGYVIAAIVLMAVVTFCLRALPFVAGKWLNKSLYIQFVGVFLPPSIMLLLVLSTIDFRQWDTRLPYCQLISVAVVALLHYWRRSVFLSVIGGTAFYMLLLHYS